ncbi:hypothetical protein HELRODRAFT_166388 [Helobdella robusta]|uniref:Prosaposin n=1 Tax=Helobdella robusta TaxID=6412 RepID=T1EY29_HELRO|nr:hypothetical protein HELRODRAFT_166388 [Helobdella robusta]ESN90683.1 hypothetical protein HELRODRAFT_166388 [Helobdella robusta]
MLEHDGQTKPSLVVSHGKKADLCSTGQKYWCSSLQNAKSCSAFEHCKATAWLNELPPKDDSETCLFCESVVKEVVQFIKQGDTEAKISNALTTLCGLIPDYQTSQEDPKVVCSMLKLCTDNKKIKEVSVAGSPECEDCIKFVGDIKVKLFGDAQKAKIIKELKKYICNNLIIGQPECNDIVDKLVPKVLDDLGEKFVPEKICRGFCKSGVATDGIDAEQLLMQKVIVMYVNIESSGSSDQCHICKEVFDDLQNLVKDKSTQTLLNDLCEIIVDDYSTFLYEFLVNELDSSTRCHFFGFCSSNNANNNIKEDNSLKFLPYAIISQGLQQQQQKKLPQQQPAKVADSTCEICKYIIDEIKKYIGENATKERIIDTLDKICYKIPEKYERNCLDFVDKYGKPLVDLLIKGISSHDVCESINLCLQGQHTFPMANLLQGHLLQPPKQSQQPQQPQQPAKITDTSCEICKYIIDEIKKYIGSNTTEEKIIEALDRICGKVPKSYEKKCLEWVKNYGKMLVELLLKGLSSEDVCQSINLCLQNDVAPNIPSPANGKCEVCEIALQYIDSLLDQNATIARVETIVKRVCTLMPSSMRAECSQIVDEFGGLIIHYVANHLNPHQICKALNLCESRAKLYYKCIGGPSYWLKTIARSTFGIKMINRLV